MAFDEGLLADELNRKRLELKLGLNDIATKSGVSYEYVRQIMRGRTIPSKFLLRVLCQSLNVEYERAIKLAVADRIRKKYGGLPLELAGKDPEMLPLERAWKYLDEGHRRDLIAQAEAWAKADSRRI